MSVKVAFYACTGLAWLLLPSATVAQHAWVRVATHGANPGTGLKGEMIASSPSGTISDAVVAQDRQAPASPAIRALASALAGSGPKALDDFWGDVARNGAPLVEPHRSRDSSLVTFVYRGGPAVRSVRLSSGLNALLIERIEPDLQAIGRMQRLAGTDLWHLSLVVGRNLRVSYRFDVATSEDTSQEVLDPLNQRVYRPDREALRASLLELPGAPPQPWHERDEELGTWRQRKMVDMRGRENDVFVYLPAGFDPQRAEPYPVLVGLDSYSFGIGMPGALLMDHLIATKAIPPTVMLAANLPGGSGLDQMDVSAEYVAERLLPQLRAELNLTSDPRRVVIAGTSRRGLIATYTAFARPQAVGNVLALSGSFYWKPEGETEYEWLTHRFATEEIRPLRLFLAVGNLETVVTATNRGHYMLGTNRHLRDVLLARGYDLEYWEFAGAHSDLSWQDALARGLVALLGGDAARR